MRRFTALAILGLFVAVIPSSAQRSPTDGGTQPRTIIPAPRPQIEMRRLERNAPTGCGFLGIYPSNIGRKASERLGLGERTGAYVSGVLDETGAMRAGIQAKDVITSLNGELVTSESHLRRLILKQTPGTFVRLDLFRNGERLTVNAEITSRSKYYGGPDCNAPTEENQHQQIEERLRDAVKDLDMSMLDRNEIDRQMLEVERELQSAQRELTNSIDGFRGQRDRVTGLEGNTGLGLQAMSKQLAQYFRTPSTNGALVNEVTDGSPAARAGMQAGDVIVSVNSREVDGPMDAVRGIVEDTDGSVELGVIRDGRERNIEITTHRGMTPQSAPNLMPDIGSHTSPQREKARVARAQDLR